MVYVNLILELRLIKLPSETPQRVSLYKLIKIIKDIKIIIETAAAVNTAGRGIKNKFNDVQETYSKLPNVKRY